MAALIGTGLPLNILNKQMKAKINIESIANILYYTGCFLSDPSPIIGNACH